MHLVDTGQERRRVGPLECSNVFYAYRSRGSNSYVAFWNYCNQYTDLHMDCRLGVCIVLFMGE